MRLGHGRLTFAWLCLLLPILVACAPAGNQPPEVTAIPTYPNVVQQATPDPTAIAAERPQPRVVQLFQTPDKPEAVLAYYDAILLKSGWHDSSATPLPDARSYQWSGGCPIHYIYINVTPGDSALTSVELKRYDLGC